MAYYDFMAVPFAKCIAAGINSIDDVFPDDLKEKVIRFLASKGLGPDGKPLPKDHIGDKGEQGEPGIMPEDGNKEDAKEEEKEPKKPVEDKKEEEPSKDSKEEDKTPVEEDKGAK